jgi:hypothetical protein
MLPESLGVRRLIVLADYYQFYHSLAVGGARNDTVETTLRVHPAEPQTGMKHADHVVEAGDYFIYEMDLWPTSKPAPVAVVKQGPNPWAG